MLDFRKPVTWLWLAAATSLSSFVVVLYWTTTTSGISGRNSDDSLSFGPPQVYSETSSSNNEEINLPRLRIGVARKEDGTTMQTKKWSTDVQQNKSLVVVLGELRGGEETWQTLCTNVLDINLADLAVFTTDSASYPEDNPLLARAKYVWKHAEYEDWADAIDTVNGTHWRSTHLPKFHDYNVYSYPGRNRSILFGGIGGHPCDPLTASVPYCKHHGSGIIVFMLRYWLMKRIQDEILPLDQYDTFVITRPDNMFLCRHRFTDLSLQNNTVWVPTGQEYGGYCDRHLVASKDSVLDSLDILRELVHQPYEWDYEKHHNTERFMKYAWSQKGLNVKQFERVMFGVKTKEDTTRWQTGEDTLPEHPHLIVKYKREWLEALKTCQARPSHNNENMHEPRKLPQSFTIVILTMDRLHSLQRLVRSLMDEDCQYGHLQMVVNIEIHVDMPKDGATASWLETIRWASNLSWPYGDVKTVVAKENLGLRDSWFNAWRPKGTIERAIILEDDVEVSKLWYRWVNRAYDAFGQNPNVAGFSLQRQDLIPLTDRKQRRKGGISDNGNEPFLYNLLGSIGFAPTARIWREFVEWTDCALCNDVDVSVDGLITSGWYRRDKKKRSMWEQHLVYYMYHQDLYCLYQFPSNITLGLASHWKEQGEHFTGKASPSHGLVEDPSELGNFHFPLEPNKFDWGANPVTAPRRRTLVVSAAVGYKEPGMFSSFLSSLRNHYSGDVVIAIATDSSREIKSILIKHNATYDEVDTQKNWHLFNIQRFRLYSKYCTSSYAYCMAIDFRDSFFQDHPFKYVNMRGEHDLIFQSHNIKFGQTVKGIPAHWKMLPHCAQNNESLVKTYQDCLMGKPLINAGGMVGTPKGFQKLSSFVLVMASGQDCSDQMAVNIGAYCELRSTQILDQGAGPINTLGYGSNYFRLGKKVTNFDCLPSPVVHQGDLVNLTDLRHPSCFTNTFAKQDLPGGGYQMVAVKTSLDLGTKFEPAERALSRYGNATLALHQAHTVHQSSPSISQSIRKVEANDVISKNEAQYNAKYWKFQEAYNKFGASFNGDMIRFVLGAYPGTVDSILEFGSSGGFILDSMMSIAADSSGIQLYGVEINLASRAHSLDKFSTSIQDVFLRTELIPPSVMFDVIYSTDVLEHTDCPLCELRTLHPKLKSNGVLIVHLRNDGADKSQGFGKYKKEQNHHIYTWNALLLANMLDSAGFIPCNVISEFSAWVHPIRVEHYERDKYAYCLLGLEQGRRDEVNNLWAVAVKDDQSCEAYRRKLEDLLDCKYLRI
mmetsp:Transcript_5928/g.13713  ORF Transcript_5928/g.13713 Transcript_5928/m.13713 type:complete len:1279 (-) Transcript_5928:130-3966(-)